MQPDDRRWWLALAALSAFVLVVQLPGPHATAWHFFELAADRLAGEGLSLYADHPEFQFGPLSIIAATPFTWLDNSGEVLVMIAGSVAGLLVVRLFFDTLEDIHPGALSGPPIVAFATAAVIVVTWGDVVVRTAHIDDALTLLAIVGAMRAVARDQPARSTIWFAIAAAAKPWGAMFAPLAAVPNGRRPWLRPIIAAGCGVLSWIPFIISAPDTLDISDFEIVNDPTSVLRALGVGAATTPSWVRPTQLIGGFLLVAALVILRRWPTALLAGVAWRLLLDPGAHRYYTIGFVLGALLVELGAHPRRVPWLTIGAAVALEITAIPDLPVGPGQAVRAAAILAALVLTCQLVVNGIRVQRDERRAMR